MRGQKRYRVVIRLYWRDGATEHVSRPIITYMYGAKSRGLLEVIRASYASSYLWAHTVTAQFEEGN